MKIFRPVDPMHLPASLSPVKASIIGLLSMLGLGSCTVINGGLSSYTHKPWRMENPLVAVFDKVDRDGIKICKQVAQLGIVEFDDQGQLWRDNYRDRNAKTPGRSELAVVLEALKQRTKKGPVQLVIFVHGWNNNASNLQKGNLNSFQEMLKSVAKVHPNPFGVFISWRGMAMSFPTLIDIYNREASALKIGQLEASAAIQALCSTAKHGQPESRVIAVGHSLGGVILLRAVAQPLATQIAKASVEQSDSDSVIPMADTVVLVNPADTAVHASQMVRVMQDYQVQYKRNGRDAPLLVSLTSKGDWATGWLYSGATWISRHVLGSFMTSSSGATSTKAQEDATVTSVGWHTSIHSHELNEAKGIAPLPLPDPLRRGVVQTESERADYLMSQNFKPSKPNEKTLAVWLDPTLRRKQVSSGPLKAYNLELLNNPNNNTPYWIFRVPKFVVYNHTDIWNSNFIGLLTAIHNASREPKPSISKPIPRPTSPLPAIKMGLLHASPPQ